MYKLVLDLEMNGICSKEIPMGEIIEIGAVLLDRNFDVIKEYSTYVRPNDLRISSKVKRLTNITEEQILTAPRIKEALCGLLEMTPDLSKTTLYTWSDSDTKAISCELNSKNIQIDSIKELCDGYVDIQDIFGKRVGIENSINLTKALNMIGLEFDGKEHGALADSINTAQILREIETNDDIKETIENINSYMTSEPLTSNMSSLFANIVLS